MRNYMLMIVVSAIITAAFIALRTVLKSRFADNKTKKSSRIILLVTIGAIIGAYLLLTNIYMIIFPPEPSEGGFKFSVDLWAERAFTIPVINLSVSVTVFGTWIVMAALIIAALIVRFTVISKMAPDSPHGLGNALEAAVEKLSDYTKSNAHGLGERTSSYIFTVALLLIGFAVLEMVGFRTPASDITFTFALGFITFILINAFGFIKKGPKRALHYLNPMNIVTDIAVPVSLASRLFGNMLGGMIIMDLIYSALKSGAVGIPSVVGLFFNVFHPLLQAFIFVTLSLTFMREAIE